MLTKPTLLRCKNPFVKMLNFKFEKNDAGAGKGFDENEINFKGKIAVLEDWFKDKSANNI